MSRQFVTAKNLLKVLSHSPVSNLKLLFDAWIFYKLANIYVGTLCIQFILNI